MLARMQDKSMWDVTNKRESDTEPNAIYIGDFSCSFYACPSLEDKGHSMIWLHLWSQCVNASEFTQKNLPSFKIQVM